MSSCQTDDQNALTTLRAVAFLCFTTDFMATVSDDVLALLHRHRHVEYAQT